MGVSHTSSEFKDGAPTGAHKVQGRCAGLGGGGLQKGWRPASPPERLHSPPVALGPWRGPSAARVCAFALTILSCPQGQGPHTTTGIQSPRVTPSGTGNPGGVRPRGRGQAGRPTCTSLPNRHLHLRGRTHHGSAPPTVGVGEVVHLGVKDVPPGPQVPHPVGCAGRAWTETQGLHRVEERRSR